MRNGLTYQQASANSNGKARKAYDDVISNGGTVVEAQAMARDKYEAEMKWYEGK